MPAPSDDDDPAPEWQVPREVTHKGLANLVMPLGPPTFRSHGGGQNHHWYAHAQAVHVDR